MRREGKLKGEEEGSVQLYHYCDKCEKRYTEANYLKQHIKAEHEGRIISCPFCDKIFRRNQELSEHKLKDSGQPKQVLVRFWPKILACFSIGFGISVFSCFGVDQNTIFNRNRLFQPKYLVLA